MLKHLVDSLDTAAVIGNAARAYEASLAPNPRIPNSAPTNLELRLGDPEEHPRSSLTMKVVFKKATANAALPSMKKMKRPAAPNRAGGAGASSSRMDVDGKEGDETEDEQAEEEEPDEGGLVSRQVIYFHLPDPKPPVAIDELEAADKAKVDGSGEVKDEKEEEEEATDDEGYGKGPQLSRDQLKKAFRYGNTKVPVDELDPDTLTLSTKLGVDIIGFIKKDAVSLRAGVSSVNVLIY
jgi:hypothetical protein